MHGSHDDIYRAMLEDSWHAHQTGLTSHEQLGLVGRVVFIDGVLKGYTFGYPLNSEIFCILFEVTDLSIKGTSTISFQNILSGARLRIDGLTQWTTPV